MANKKLNYTAEEINNILDKANTMELPTKTSQLTNDSGYLTEIPNEYITETELEEKGYLTEHQDISGKADKTELHEHSNKTILDGITNTKVQSWDNKSEFSGNYNDLTNKPNIPSIEGLASEEYVDNEIKKMDVTEQLTDYAKKSDIPTKVSELINDKNYLISIPNEYITESELNAKSYVKTVNGITPNENGNVTISVTVDSIEELQDMLEKLLSNTNVGYVDINEDNAIGIIDIPQDTYTLRYKNGNTVLSNYYDIGIVEDTKIFNRDFIKENIPPYESTRIGVYDKDGKEVGGIPLYYFKKERGERLYSFGVLSDVHNQTSQTAEPTEDLQRALRLFNEREDVEFTCISGDITETATETEFQIFQNNIQTCSPDTPVYSTPGNHDCSGSSLNLALWKQYTGCDRTYEITYNGDHFLFLGMDKWSMGNSSCTPYLMEDLIWLSEKLETYKNERCFIFTHLFFPEHAGNLKEIYPPANWLMGTQHDFLKDLLNHYINTVWFSGHSHWKWYLQKHQDNANIQRAGGWTVHIPSCASPIDSDGVSTRVSKPLESEGAIIDVYEDYIDIRGIDLKNDMYIPMAQYRLDTTLVEIIQKECQVTLNLNNATASNNTNKVTNGEPYTNTINTISNGTMIITVTMGGVNITSTAVNDNKISIDKVTEDIVINVVVIEGFSTDLLDTNEIHLNQRWSSSSNAFVESDGTIAFSVPFADIKGRTIKIIGFPEEHDGKSTWYAYNASGTMIGRIADSGSGVLWDSTALVDNGDGSYDLPISKEIFVTNGTTPITTTPTTIYITMYVQDTPISSISGLKMLLSDVEENEEPPIDSNTPIEGFSTDLLDTNEIYLNKRWSSSSKDYSEKLGALAFSVPFADINGRTIKIIGFPEEHDGVSTWYIIDSSNNTIGRIADGSAGVVWDSSALTNNGDGSYDLVISKELFKTPGSQNAMTGVPSTLYITMYVQEFEVTSLNGFRILVSD